jgi:hypothetical protein
MHLSQSEWIAVAILAGFLIFLAIKGKLANYWSLLTGGAAAGTSSTASSSTASSSTTAGGLAGAAAGAATGALPSGGTSTNSATVSGTITNNGQTATTTFPTIPGTNVPMPQVTI